MIILLVGRRRNILLIGDKLQEGKLRLLVTLWRRKPVRLKLILSYRITVNFWQRALISQDSAIMEVGLYLSK